LVPTCVRRRPVTGVINLCWLRFRAHSQRPYLAISQNLRFENDVLVNIIQREMRDGDNFDVLVQAALSEQSFKVTGVAQSGRAMPSDRSVTIFKLDYDACDVYMMDFILASNCSVSIRLFTFGAK